MAAVLLTLRVALRKFVTVCQRRPLVPVSFGLAALILGVGIWKALSDTNRFHYVPYNPAYDQYLSAFTDGEVACNSPIRIQFQDGVLAADARNTNREVPLDFSPNIEGTAKWLNDRTLEFTPAEWLPHDQRYSATLDLDELVDGVPDSLRKFRFQFRTKPQAIAVEADGLTTLDLNQLKWQRLTGEVVLNDVETRENVEKSITVTRNGRAVPLVWEYEKNARAHRFVADSLRRTQEPAEVVLKWDGTPLGLDRKGKRTFKILALGDFDHVDTYTHNDPEQYVVLEFSDPLNPNQDLAGLIALRTATGEAAFDAKIEQNKIKLYPKQRLHGRYTLEVFPGIENAAGYKMQAGSQDVLVFQALKPQVKLIGEGVILPQAKTLPFTFETVGLKAVDVRIIQVFEKNVPQFLQVNQLNGSEELRRVGRVVYRQKVNLDASLDLRSWNKHVLDLSRKIRPEPGAIYEVALGYRPSYVVYDCPQERIVAEGKPEPDMLDPGTGWDRPGNYYTWYSSYGYDEPCSWRYYRSDKVVRRNVLASAIGLMAKRGTDGNLRVVATDLISTEPLSGVQLQVIDYQQLPMANGSTGQDGEAVLAIPDEPFLLVAKRGNERGYLRLDDGSALSMSRFDVAGARYTQGLKGFIYGERGVWRPGDPMYLSFILEDPQGTLPDNHPVNVDFFNPEGQKVQSLVLREGVNGFYTFVLQTDESDPTGTYRCNVQVGGATFTKRLKVETVLPNRLKIQLQYPQAYLVAGQQSTGHLRAEWLHGATAGNLRASVKVSLYQLGNTAFTGYRNYVFDDPYRSFGTTSQLVYEGRLDAEGKAALPTKLDVPSGAPGRLQASVFTRVFEPGGNASIDRYTMDFHPYDTYVGIDVPDGSLARGALVTDQRHSVNFVTLLPGGQPRASRTLQVELRKLKWRWWWEDDDGHFSYNSRRYSEVVEKTTLTTDANGRATWGFQVNRPNWGRYLIRAVDEKSGHASAAVVYIDWPAWAGRSYTDDPEGAKMLTFSADAEAYAVGDAVTLNLPTPDAGRAYVSIEAGGRVLETHWVNATRGTTKFTFNAQATMAPNCYAVVHLLQPHGQTANDLPLRMYGVLPLKVEDKAGRLAPVLRVPQATRPNAPMRLSVSEKTGRPMTYTVAVVDEGLLDLTRFSTPDPWAAFNKRQALAVKTWDLYDAVVGAVDVGIGNLLSLGGGAGEIIREGNAADAKANRFRPVVKFLGPFTLAAGQSQTHTVDLPNYVGSVRTMVIAGQAGAYGHAEAATKVNSPLMALATLPRVLGPGESLEMPVTIFTTQDNLQNVSIRTSATGLVQLADSETKVLSFSGKGEQVVGFKLNVAAGEGTGRVRVVATSGNETAVYETDIVVRNPNERVTDVYNATVQPGAEWAKTFNAIGLDGTNAAELEVSTVPPFNLGRRLKYLIRYPYGCIEQTTSSVFPQLYLSKLLKLSPEQQAATDRNIKAGIRRLRSFQLSDGGFAYWPGALEASAWGTNYAGHFLLEARRLGYAVPDGMYYDWKRYLSRLAREWRSGDSAGEITQAYRLYLLALSDDADMGAMNRLRNGGALPTVAKWYLAAAYGLAGQRQEALKLSGSLPTAVAEYRELSHTYGSHRRDEAIVLDALSSLGRFRKASEVARRVSATLSEDRWLSTQTTAYCLSALARYVGATAEGTAASFTYRLSGGDTRTVGFREPLWTGPLPVASTNALTLKNTGERPLYPRVIHTGVPLQGDDTRAANGMSLRIRFYQSDGTPLETKRLPQGTDFYAEVTVTHTGTGDYDELALHQVFPSGWEVLNERMVGPLGVAVSAAEYLDVRDDRVYTFFDLAKGQTKTFRVYLTAAYKGRYYLPPTHCSAMYDHTLNAREPGGWVEVIE